jgi:hypothetical protein
MQNRTRRPISVYIAQIAMLLLSILFFLPIFLIVPTFLRNPGAFSLFGISVAIVIYIGLLAIFQIAFWGMVKRKSYGRWLSVVSLSVISILGVVGNITRPKGPFEYQEYANSTQAAAGFMAGVVLISAISALILVMSFSRRVRNFFDPNALEDGQLGLLTDDKVDQTHDPKIEV